MRLAPSADEIRARLGDAWPVRGTIDCHAHVFESGFPLSARRGFDPLPYPLEYYLAWIHALGIARCVQVTASCYGFDNSVARYAMEECGAGGVGARGVATIHPEIGHLELEKLAAAGFVGARLAASRIDGLALAAFDEIARRCAPVRWHVEVNVDRCEEWLDLEARLARSPVPVVFEHLGAIGEHEAAASAPGIKAVLRLLDKRPDFAIKLSSFTRIAQQAQVVKLFAREYPDRLMWGSNLAPAGDDLELIALALEWLPEAGLRRRIFSANAQRLYGL
jgi:predicted TIM-barrel fold metal-dependent hydrolase